MPLKQGEKKKPEALVKGVEFIFSPGDWRLHTAHLCFRSKKEIEISIAACWNALRYPRCQRRSDHSNAFFFFYKNAAEYLKNTISQSLRNFSEALAAPRASEMSSHCNLY